MRYFSKLFIQKLRAKNITTTIIQQNIKRTFHHSARINIKTLIKNYKNKNSKAKLIKTNNIKVNCILTLRNKLYKIKPDVFPLKGDNKRDMPRSNAILVDEPKERQPGVTNNARLRPFLVHFAQPVSGRGLPRKGTEVCGDESCTEHTKLDTEDMHSD